MKKHLTITALAVAMSLGILHGSATAVSLTDNGTVTDPVTNLVWLKDAGCLGKATTINGVLTRISTLATGVCGLKDGSASGDWRLPTVNELLARSANRQGFANIQPDRYWTRTDDDKCDYMFVDMSTGRALNCVSEAYIWPVRPIKQGFVAF